MKLLFQFVLLVICVIFYGCTESSTIAPPPTPDPTGRLVLKSNPPGARIYLLGSDTGKNTPDSLVNLQAGDYDIFLYLQYYDTSFFTASVFNNLTTTKEVILVDGLPSVEIDWNYSTAHGGDSVKFRYQFNQDVLIDSVVIERPIDDSGLYTTERYYFNNQLFLWKDVSGNPINYYLPPVGSGNQYYPRIQSFSYWIHVYGQKAYGLKAAFHIIQGLNT
ncbi:MAG: PEGA domain-containing protein [Ignavibacteriales bacterium]